MLTPREVAASLFTTARSLGTRRVLGAEAALVLAERVALLDRTERAIEGALTGPERRFITEPDNPALQAMLTQVRERRTTVQDNVEQQVQP